MSRTRHERSEPQATNDQGRNPEPSGHTFRRIRDPHSMVAELRPGDGVDPRNDRRGNHRDKADHAVLRLAGQVQSGISSALSSCGDPVLGAFDVLSVRPGKGNTFSVALYCVDTTYPYNPAEVRARAEEMKGYIRSVVAREVTRKRAPDFRFDVASPGTPAP